MSERILVLGANGLLGTPLCLELKSRGLEFLSASQIQGAGDVFVDLCDQKSIESAISSAKPSRVINCAAYTAVDEAETDYALAFAVNAQGVAYLAQACDQEKIHLTHISTDYVFGQKQSAVPFKEDDEVKPLGIYGLSKWYGELLLNASCNDSIIVRTSWLHGADGANFIDTMLNLSKTKEQLKVVNDQVGSLTWAPWLAKVVVELSLRQERGLVHASSHGYCSWFDVATEVFRQAGVQIEVLPVGTEEFPRPAPRPSFSALNTDKLRGLLGIPEFSWQESISSHLQAAGIVG